MVLLSLSFGLRHLLFASLICPENVCHMADAKAVHNKHFGALI